MTFLDIIATLMDRGFHLAIDDNELHIRGSSAQNKNEGIIYGDELDQLGKIQLIESAWNGEFFHIKILRNPLPSQIKLSHD